MKSFVRRATGASIVALVAAFAGCSSSTSGGTGSPDDAGTGADTGGSDSGGSSDSGGPADGDSGSGGDSGTCESTPTLHLDTANEVYCLHAANDQTLDCTLPQVCCLGGTDTSLCAAPGSTCPSPLVTLNCTTGAQCAAGSVCCAAGPAPGLDAKCGYFAESGMSSSSCVSGTTCPQGLFRLCGSTAECAACTPFRHASGDQLGFCN